MEGTSPTFSARSLRPHRFGLWSRATVSVRLLSRTAMLEADAIAEEGPWHHRNRPRPPKNKNL